MTTTWYLGALIAAGAVGAALLLHRRWWERLAGLSPTQPADPDETDGEPEEHEGATEEWSPLRAAGDSDDTGAELLANLKASTLAEVALVDALADRVVAVYDTAAADLAALDEAFRHDVNYIWGRFFEWLDIDARGTAWLAAGLPDDTSEFDRRELDALLAVS